MTPAHLPNLAWLSDALQNFARLSVVIVAALLLYSWFTYNQLHIKLRVAVRIGLKICVYWLLPVTLVSSTVRHFFGEPAGSLVVPAAVLACLALKQHYQHRVTARRNT